MGYEVMDAGGTRHDTAPNESVPPIEVIELNPDDVHAVPLATRPAAWRTALARARAANRPVLLAAGAALVIGALAGGLVTGARDAASLTADRQRSQLAVVAQVESSSARLQNATVRIDVTAHVTNLGSEPVDLITPSRLAVGPSDERLAPGTGSSVRLQLRQPCGLAAERGLAVTVRTADGRLHEVPLRQSEPLGMLCASSTNPVLRVLARVEGTTERPELVVINPRAEPVRVSFASVVSQGSPAVNGLIAVLTEPAMPLVIGAGEQGRASLDVRATRCVKDLAAISQLSQISFPALLVSRVNGLGAWGDPGTEDIGGSVDISLLVGQALARACR